MLDILIDNNSQIKIHAKFDEGINVIYGYSGTGKTFMFEKINNYYANSKDFRVALVDYNYSNKSEELIVEFCKNTDLVLLDNADLYLTESLVNKLRSICRCIVISMKNTVFFHQNEVNILSVEYKNHLIRTIKR